MSSVEFRSGIGYDVHPFVEGRPLILGGTRIEHTRGLDGHSDADVVSHAIADALLGALALGDMGQHFPPTDPTYACSDSLELLKHVVVLVATRRAAVVHVDVTVIAEEPRLSPYIGAMAERLRGALGVETGRVSVKATTHERLGSLGRGEGIGALAVATVRVEG